MLRYLWVLLPAVAGACDLAPVEIPLGNAVVVVHGVMRSDEANQFIVVERSFTGDIEDVFLGYAIPSDGAPASPIRGATVQVTNVDFPDDPCGNPVSFVEETGDPEMVERPGVYWAPAGCPTLNPGDSLELVVETPEGETVTGAALVTAMEQASLTVLGETVPFGADTVITFNRDRDILRLEVEPIAGRMLQVGVFRVGELDMFYGEDIWPGARIHADTMSLAIPGDLVDAGGWSDGGDVFRAGRDYLMTVAVVDLNYYDFSRSSSNKYTGRGFLNRLSGGIGVFGSLAAHSLPLRVLGEFDDEREGVYWLRGVVQGVSVDAYLTVFTTRSAEDTEVSALLTGDWFWRGPAGEGTTSWQPLQIDRLAFEGTLKGNSFRLVAHQPESEIVRITVARIVLAGDRRADASFALAVSDSMRIQSVPLGTVTVSQQ
jgi:hypothetical protein